MRPQDLTNLLSGVPMPLVLIGENERIVALNASAEEIFGARMAGLPYIALLRQPQVLESIERALSRGEKTTSRYLGTAGSRPMTYRVFCAPVPLEAGTGVLVSFEDISHLEDASQIRRDFVANVSHELRTPLTALIGFIETLRGPAKEDAAARDRFLAIMEKETRRMTRLVTDLLSLSRVESEERLRPAGEINLGHCLASARQALRPLAEEAGVAVSIEAPEAPVIVPGDADQLQQVFNNLIENAIKYGGRNKSVTLRLTRQEAEPMLRGPAARVDVIDEGEGIDPIHLPRLTERFYRVDSHRSREMGGTGLGLAIVKHIVNRHRGRLRISSKPGQGTVFSVILPAERG
ncbi:Alkaline phosphatase synthesis sensor protein PhoR [Pseudoruegeria aquimaris]|uniref:histidine kinase n=1 Tax=Pseudoruegeria aquimaris TaxID=393663 RepID=A0A1Y5RHY1_9RHOB|nr:ATP-binding protein [Pseudoruegeria aquimaris]SLN17979.1 Alkaline phosphatase synthesis sensor protein PhoR [Pseudoruegeria aquimaris]